MPPTDTNQGQSYVYSSDQAQRPSFFKRRSGKIFILVVIILVFLVIATALIKPAGPEAMANKFIGYVLKDQPNQAYQLTSSSFRSTSSISELHTVIESVDSSCSGNPRLSSEKLYKSSASYVFLTNGSNSSTCHMQVELSEKSGKWFIDFFNEY